MDCDVGEVMKLVLSLFPGVGLLDRAFEEAGFCVVRGPDLLWGGDVRRFNPPRGRFDGVIGGPPCQAFSPLRHVVKANGLEISENLIPEFERVVIQAQPSWFLMENVPQAPAPFLSGYVKTRELTRDVWVGGLTARMRAFTFGMRDDAAEDVEKRVAGWQIETLALHPIEPEHSALASGGGRPVPVAVGGSGKRKISAKSALKNYGYKNADQWTDHLRKQGLPSDFLKDAPFTVVGKIEAVGNGVPMAMGRAVARATLQAVEGCDGAMADTDAQAAPAQAGVAQALERRSLDGSPMGG